MIRILWLSPNFNHYKARFLNHLAKESEIELSVLSGSGRSQMGDKKITANWNFRHIEKSVSKQKFGWSIPIVRHLKSVFSDFDWVLIPAEKKNLPLFLYLLYLRKSNPSTKLISYNHPILKSKKGKTTLLDRVLTKFYFNKLDRVIFYTEESYKYMVNENKIISPEKAFWANNTLDNIEIAKNYTFNLPPANQFNILFIGRLIATKRLDDLLKYYAQLKVVISGLKLEIIGDGPQKNIIESAIMQDDSIIWHGAVVDESEIAPIMQRSSLIFVPGHSGLSINHAFAYGRPYITLRGSSHAPEIDYIDNGKNGYILSDDNEVVKKISELLKNREKLENFCHSANEKGKRLSVQNWVQQIKISLMHE
ncbi:glycosyltransferase family 4 protein [Winogradskyella sp. MIT101101]|uniref:glycosyltransferase family 4 protein n=1 Tax=Winogradskyella sp. MIT101101 TaxID=3098297 RepID=UPI00399BDE30